MIKSILSRVPISSSKRDKNQKDLTLTDEAQPRARNDFQAKKGKEHTDQREFE